MVGLDSLPVTIKSLWVDIVHVFDLRDKIMGNEHPREFASCHPGSYSSVLRVQLTQNRKIGCGCPVVFPADKVGFRIPTVSCFSR